MWEADATLISSGPCLPVVAVPLRCPRDGATAMLESVRGPKGRFRLDVCPRCGGAWFDKGEIAKISGDREIERMVVEYAGGASGLACPRCGRPMVERPIGEATLDVCAECKGVWVDSGELEEAARTLRGEMPTVSSSGEMSGLARAAMMASTAFGPSNTLRLLLNPRIERKSPPEDL